MIAVKGIPAEVRRRVSPDQFVTVQFKQIAALEEDGWVVDKRNQRTVRMRKPKPHDIAFEDRVWAAFAKLDFFYLNRDRTFTLRYGTATGETQQVDVFAADDEVVLVVECKSSEDLRTVQFKKEIEAIQGQRPGILKEIKKEFPNHKVKFVLATNNFGVTRQTVERIAEADVIHMDEDVIEYYIGLADHLGRAARYQLLGNLFAGTKIPNLDPEVVAIEAHMGGHKYYSFSIEPERLLKLSYILHRNKANSNLMPTYQRLIKKARLKGVSQFVEAGGYFPNSLILSLDAGVKGLKFEPFAKHIGDTRAGILHLPQTFRAAYVIDGQHRLYGYADSTRAASDLIPVVAFTNLERADQVRLFMQINENQQAVPKNLRNTLNADLLYDSKDLRERNRALKLFIAQQLGEDKTSPLYGRILIGENAKTAIRCLTIDAISRGIDRGNFLGSFTKSEVKEFGSFYRGSNDATAPPLIEYLSLGLDHVRQYLETQYKLGSAEGGFVFINNGVESLIRILGDIADHVVEVNGYNPREQTPEQLFAEASAYIDSLIDFLDSLDPAAGLEYRQLYGSGAGTKYWRRLQQAINTARPDFRPPGLAEYLQSEEKQFNDESRDMIAELEVFMKRDIRKRLEDEYGATWLKAGVPKKIQVDAGKVAVERNAERDPGHELEPWDCLYIVDFKAIMTQTQDMWKRLFEQRYTRPGDEAKAGGWKARSDWIVKLNDLRNEVSHGRTVTAEDHDFLVTLTTWLIKGQADNDL
jgi:DNA sulfur modification protein DndB